jgi:hypothetical protein
MRKARLLPALSLIALAATAGATAAGGTHASATSDPPVKAQVFAPRPGDTAGKASKGFVVDLAAQYPSLASSGPTSS